MDAFTESVLASFDSDNDLVWDLKSTTEASARFYASQIEVVVTFRKVDDGWEVGFTSSKESTVHSFGIFSGVFQAVREFLSVRQPERLTLSSNDEVLALLYEAYLEHKGTELHAMGYKMAEPVAPIPLKGFGIVKSQPSVWHH